jgi:hypothetical protein
VTKRTKRLEKYLINNEAMKSTKRSKMYLINKEVTNLKTYNKKTLKSSRVHSKQIMNNINNI